MRRDGQRRNRSTPDSRAEPEPDPVRAPAPEAKAARDEPHWAPLPRRRFGAMQVAGILARHLVPLLGVLLLRWPAGDFLLMSVFNIAFSIAGIAVVGVAVSVAQERAVRNVDAGPLDAVAGWLTLALVGIVASVGLTALFGWVIALYVDWNASIAWGALVIVASALPALHHHYVSDLRARLGEEQRKRRDQPNLLVLVLCAGLVFTLSGQILQLGRDGLVALACAVSALFAFRDLRPDLMRELVRPKDRPPSRDEGPS